MRFLATVAKKHKIINGSTPKTDQYSLKNNWAQYDLFIRKWTIITPIACTTGNLGEINKEECRENTMYDWMHYEMSTLDCKIVIRYMLLCCDVIFCEFFPVLDILTKVNLLLFCNLIHCFFYITFLYRQKKYKRNKGTMLSVCHF